MPRSLPALVPLALVLLAPPPAPAQLLHSGQAVVAEHVELNAQLDPAQQSIYAKARYELHNRGRDTAEVVDLVFPESLANRADVTAVWDRDGSLAFRLDPLGGGPRALHVALRVPLEPDKKRMFVASFTLDLHDAKDSAPARVTQQAARLETTGWYPVPAGSAPEAPGSLRAVVRLPKEWKVHAPSKVKRYGVGTALASYEVDLKPVRAGTTLLEAHPTQGQP